ncbi:MAG: PadR family transcriptional regulator [Gemmatimonadetes bacterium]|nr:PadR family transcriptional regulator [Gemmatimonadota bacterium]NNM06431.1 PadR family transcriptional regulator [Gemmatimonadota bacterium]
MLFSPSLTKGSVEFIILSILEDGELYGYEITKQIQERSQSLLAFRRSSIYPVLSRMEGRGWISRRWSNGNRRRCFYSLTEDGSEALDRQRVEWRVFTTAVNLVVGGNGTSEDPEGT